MVSDKSKGEDWIDHRAMDMTIKADEDEMMMNIPGPDQPIQKSNYKLMS